MSKKSIRTRVVRSSFRLVPLEPLESRRPLAVDSFSPTAPDLTDDGGIQDTTNDVDRAVGDVNFLNGLTSDSSGELFSENQSPFASDNDRLVFASAETLGAAASNSNGWTVHPTIDIGLNDGSIQIMGDGVSFLGNGTAAFASVVDLGIVVGDRPTVTGGLSSQQAGEQLNLSGFEPDDSGTPGLATPEFDRASDAPLRLLDPGTVDHVEDDSQSFDTLSGELQSLDDSEPATEPLAQPTIEPDFEVVANRRLIEPSGNSQSNSLTTVTSIDIGRNQSIHPKTEALPVPTQPDHRLTMAAFRVEPIMARHHRIEPNRQPADVAITSQPPVASVDALSDWSFDAITASQLPAVRHFVSLVAFSDIAITPLPLDCVENLEVATEVDGAVAPNSLEAERLTEPLSGARNSWQTAVDFFMAGAAGVMICGDRDDRLVDRRYEIRR